MSFFSRAFGIRADSMEDPNVPLGSWGVLLELMGFQQSDAGMVVNEHAAMRLSAVQACVRAIAETLASLPLNVYQQIDRGKIEAHSHRLWPILHDTPNPQMTAMGFREAVTAQVLLWGNGYAEIQRDRSGRVVALWPLPSDRTHAVRKGGVLTYETESQQGPDSLQVIPSAKRVIDAEDVIHVPGLSYNGIVGMSPIQLARQTIGLSLAAERFGSLFFGNGSRPSGVLSHPKALRPEARANIERSFQQATSRENAQRAIVLEEGITWTPMSVPPDDAQFIETRQFQIPEIARIFRVPPHLIGDLSKSTNNNIEQQSMEFVMHCLRPWAVRWEQELNRKLLGGPFFASHDLTGLLRGDFQSRMAGYQILRNSAVISANEIREKEGWNPIPEEEGGDLLLAPLNMTPLEQLAKQEETGEAPGAGGDQGDDVPPKDPNATAQRGRVTLAFGRLFRDGVGRAVKREKRDEKAMRSIFAPAVTAMAESLAALEFPHPRSLTGEAHSIIAAHAGAIAERAANWTGGDLAEIAAGETRRAYDALLARLDVLTEAIQ